MMIAGYINIWITGDSIGIEEITRELGITPSYSYKKDERKTVRGKEVTYNNDAWIYGKRIEASDDFEDQMEDFINKIWESREYVKTLAQRAEILFQLSLYPEVEQLHVHFPNGILEKVAQMGMSVDISLAYLKRYYEMRYE